MGLAFQNELLKYPKTIKDISHKISFEAELQLPEDYPGCQEIIGGDYQIGQPQLLIDRDTLIISGQIYPSLLYRTESISGISNSLPVNNEESETADYPIDSEAVVLYQPREYGVSWLDEGSVIFQEELAVPGLQTDMEVQVSLAQLNCSFEKIGPNSVKFSGLVEALVHLNQTHSAPVISQLSPGAPEKYQVLKETVQVESDLVTKTVSLSIQSMLTIPKIKPGIARTLKVLAKPAGVFSEATSGKHFIKGSLEVSLIYIGCDDNNQPSGIFVNEWTRLQDTAISFEIPLEGAGADLHVTPAVAVTECKVTGRAHHELNLQAVLNCQVTTSKAVQQEVMVDLVPGPNEIVDTQKYLLEFEEFSGTAAGDLDFDFPLELPVGLQSAERILAFQGRLTGFETEVTEEKALVNGNLNLQLYYIKAESADPELAVATWNNSIPVSGIVQFPGLQPLAAVRNHLTLDSLNLEVTGERHFRLSGTVKSKIYASIPRAIFVLSDCAEVIPGDPSTKPSMLFYIVQPGDTLWKVARRYQTTVDSLVRANGLAASDQLLLGQKLLIPKNII